MNKRAATAGLALAGLALASVVVWVLAASGVRTHHSATPVPRGGGQPNQPPAAQVSSRAVVERVVITGPRKPWENQVDGGYALKTVSVSGAEARALDTDLSHLTPYGAGGAQLCSAVSATITLRFVRESGTETYTWDRSCDTVSDASGLHKVTPGAPFTSDVSHALGEDL